MKIIVLKSSILIALMIVFLAMSFMTKDAINSKLFVSISIIVGAFASHNLSTQNQTKNE